MRLKKFKFKIVNSTNDLAIQIIKKTNNKSGIVIAESQKKGRGRYGKRWTSFRGNLFVSIFFNIDKLHVSLNRLTKINCILVKKFLSSFYKGTILIKKPNDLLIQKKKISGILQETLTKDNKHFIIIGVGVNLVKSPSIKNYPTTNLLELTNTRVNINKAVLELINIYEKFIPIFPKFNKQSIRRFK